MNGVRLYRAPVILAALAAVCIPGTASAASTAFTYQAELGCMRRIRCLLLSLAASACVGYAFAQSGGYVIDDTTLDPMTALYGGEFGLEGHIGQPVTGKASAGPYQLTGGFTPKNSSRIFANGFEP